MTYGMRYKRARDIFCLALLFLAACGWLGSQPCPAEHAALAPSSLLRSQQGRHRVWLAHMQMALKKYNQKYYRDARAKRLTTHERLAFEEPVYHFLERELAGMVRIEAAGRQQRLVGERRQYLMIEDQGAAYAYLLLEGRRGWTVMPAESESADSQEDLVVAGVNLTISWQAAIREGKIPSLQIAPDNRIAYRLSKDDLVATDEQLVGPWRMRLNEHRGGRPGAMTALQPHGPDCPFCLLHAGGGMELEKICDIPLEGGRYWRSLFNKNPFAKDGHMIWMPMIGEDLDAREQKLTYQDLLDLFTIGRGESSKNNMFIINSQGSASINHIHMQSLYFPDDVPLAAEMSGWGLFAARPGFKVEFNMEYPAPVLRIDIGDAKSAGIAQALIDAFEAEGIELSMVLRNNKFYIFPREETYMAALPGIKIGALEMMGLFIVTDKNVFSKFGLMGDEDKVRAGLTRMAQPFRKIVPVMRRAIAKASAQRDMLLPSDTPVAASL